MTHLPDGLDCILVVEDDRDIREVAKLALEQIGDLQVATCSKGADAFDTALELAPDLILLDVMMPGTNGVTVLGQLADAPETADIPVVFLTARAQPDELEEYRRLGVADVVVKPFDPMELPGRVVEAFREAE